MEPEQDPPIAREPWQRLLRERYDAPPEVTDARIRQAARRALAPRPSRWWLPASLAASVLLAVMLVQWQYGDDRAPAYVTESDVAAPASVAPSAADSVPGAAAADERVLETRESPAAEAAIAPPYVPPPLMELPETRAAADPARDRVAPTTGMAADEAMRDAAPAAPAQAAELSSFGKLGGLKESAEAPRDPGKWYEEIEALRAAGRIDDAEAELARLEAAWPGWLEKNHPQNH